ncbi:hypothetical protein HRED_04163 [Candidatus Haloredivivus sp. G17]|nr:hypothetical protein HRED_04163 [Candidatus Haloredivivus sp. G17]
MNRKALTLALAAFLMVGLASAQAVQITDAGEFPSELTGGEEFCLGLNYSVDSPDEVPLALEFKAFYNGSEVSDEAYDLSVEDYEEACDGVRCNLNDTDEDGSVELQIDSSPRLRPGAFDFELDLLSSVGLGEESASKNVSEGERVIVDENDGLDDAEVVAESETNGTTNVTELDFVAADSPSDDSEFIGGVEVNVEDENGDDAGENASGTVRVEFDEGDVEGLERDSLQVHFYNESISEWEALDSEVGDNFVEAEVDHFSVYSVFGEQEDSSGGSSISIDPEEFEEDDEEENETDQNQTQEEDGQNQQQENDQSGEDGRQQDQQETSDSDEDSDDQDPQSLTGQFVDQASNPVAVGVIVLLALIAAGIYTGKFESLNQRIKDLR